MLAVNARSAPPSSPPHHPLERPPRHRLNDTLPLFAAHHDLITTKGWTAVLDHTTGDVTWTRPDGHTIIVPAPRRP
jgi:hypothetical protein